MFRERRAYKMITWPRWDECQLEVEMCVCGYSPPKTFRWKMSIVDWSNLHIPSASWHILNGIHVGNIIFTCWNSHSVSKTTPTLQAFSVKFTHIGGELRSVCELKWMCVAHFISQSDIRYQLRMLGHLNTLYNGHILYGKRFPLLNIFDVHKTTQKYHFNKEKV